jgi:hypothetical protein
MVEDDNKMATGVKACRKPVSSIIGEVDGFLLSVELSD